MMDWKTSGPEYPDELEYVIAVDVNLRPFVAYVHPEEGWCVADGCWPTSKVKMWARINLPVAEIAGNAKMEAK